MERHKPELLCCSEARITENIINTEYAINGYESVECFSENRHTGGVIMYVRCGKKYRILENKCENGAFWYLAIEITDDKMKGVYSVCYRSPNKMNKVNDGIYEAITCLDTYMEKIMKHDRFNLIMGDINIDIKKNDKKSRQIKELAVKHGLKIINKFNTRENKKDGSIIDIILTNKEGKVQCNTIEEDIISDHATIQIDLQLEKKEVDKSRSRVLSWKNYSKENLMEGIRNCEWTWFNKFNLDEKVDCMYNNVVKAVTPLVKWVKIKNNFKPNEWFDKEVKEIRGEKAGLYYKWKKEGKQEKDWKNYIVIRNQYNSLIKEKKAYSMKIKFIEVKNDQIKMWKMLKKLMENKKMKTNGEIEFDKVKYNNDDEISEKFNAYFVNSVIKINELIPRKESNESFLKYRTEEFKFKMTNLNEIMMMAKELMRKVNKTELCNAKVWYDSLDYTGFFIKEVINESLKSGYFPERWKTAVVVPIPKIKNTKDSTQFRPINMMRNDEKIMEKIVKNQLMEYVESNCIISTKQSAYRRNHSCETVINYVMFKFTEALDRDEIVIAVFLDLKRAFETIDRDKLLEKLYFYGIRNIELEWFRSYLNGRKQKTKFNSKYSSEIEVPIGIPQGTQLSVILFILYINDIVNVPMFSEIVLLADDALVIVTEKCLNMAIEKMNYDLERIFKWLCANKLFLNCSKTQYMILGVKKSNETNKTEIKIDNHVIQKVEKIKYLGITIDDQMTMNEQIEEVVKKTAHKVNFLKRIAKKLPEEHKKIVCNAIIDPNFNYCASIYIHCNKQQIERMQIIQNRAMKIILNCDFYTSRDVLLERMNWLSINQKIKYNIILLIYKMKNGLAPKYLNDKIEFVKNTHIRNTRNREKLNIKRTKKEKYKKSLLVEGFQIFNELPEGLTNEINFQIFKKKAKTYVREKISV